MVEFFDISNSNHTDNQNVKSARNSNDKTHVPLRRGKNQERKYNVFSN